MVTVFRRLIGQKGRRLLIALLLAVGTIASVSVAASPAAMAAGCDPTPTAYGSALKVELPLNETCYNHVLSHKCTEIGGNGSTDADECADLEISWSSSQVDIWSEGEYYCQGAVTRCSAMSVQNQLVLQSSFYGNKMFPVGYKCSGTSCPNGSRAMVASPHFSTKQVGGDTCLVEVLADDEAGNSITVPNDKITYSGDVTSPKWTYICF
jgi:hypothetical protein